MPIRSWTSKLGWPAAPGTRHDSPGEGLGWPDAEVSRETGPEPAAPEPAAPEPACEPAASQPAKVERQDAGSDPHADPATSLTADEAAGHTGPGGAEAGGQAPLEGPADQSPPASGQDSSDTPLDQLPATAGEAVSRETSALPPEETPIAAAAAQAVRVRTKRADHAFPRPPSTRVITIANQKGGVGKTTTTVNLAVALALHEATVLVIDLDPQGNASTGLGVAHQRGIASIYPVLIEELPLDRAAVQVEAAAGLHCVPATIDLAGAEIELVSVPARESRLKNAIEHHLAGLAAAGHPHPDYILIDCPPSLGLLTINALVAANEILIPIQCEYYALEGLGQLLNNIDLVKDHLHATAEISAILLTMYDARTRLADQVAHEVRQHFGELVLRSVIPRSVRISEAPGFGQSVLTYDPGSRGALSYLEAARELALRGAADPPGSSKPVTTVSVHTEGARV